MIDLRSYIKHEFIKDKFTTECEIVRSMEQAKNLANSILLGHRYNLLFENSSLKNYFFSSLKQLDNKVTIINCESSLDRLEEDINDLYANQPTLCVFDHINNCTDSQVFESIEKLNGIMVC